MKNKFLIAILSVGLLTIYLACEKDDSVVKEEHVSDNSDIQQTPTLRNLTYDDVGDTFNRLKNELQIDPYLQLQQILNSTM